MCLGCWESLSRAEYRLLVELNYDGSVSLPQAGFVLFHATGFFAAGHALFSGQSAKPENLAIDTNQHLARRQVDQVEGLGGKLEALEIGQEGDRRTLALDLGLPQGTDMAQFVAEISDVEHVLDVQWMR